MQSVVCLYVPCGLQEIGNITAIRNGTVQKYMNTFDTLLNQVDYRLALVWFLKNCFVGLHACVCLPLMLIITSGVM